MVARRAHNPKVVGSSPAPATKIEINRIPYYYSFYGDIAQLGERIAGSDEVRGSIPLISTSRFVYSCKALIL